MTKRLKLLIGGGVIMTAAVALTIGMSVAFEQKAKSNAEVAKTK
ncbi:hypothetical protein [Mycoplasma procyoni]|nr:hypothetical protein [Mycoplasma procyoni]